jgi:hypothetical protein
MKLKGSCQCAKIKFTVESETPYPFQFCYCTVCRKVTGGLCGCNIMGIRKTLKLTGKPYLKCYHATLREGGRSRKSKAERWFCGHCGTHLWLLDEQWPEGVWPNAAVIDTPLPVPPPAKTVHCMLADKPKWVPIVTKGKCYAEFGPLSIADWHARNAPTKSKHLD